MKSYSEIQTYKRNYYLLNKRKLCEYSKCYYKYSKCKGDLSTEEISESLRQFMNKYKKNYKKNDMCKIQINHKPISISFT